MHANMLMCENVCMRARARVCMCVLFVCAYVGARESKYVYHNAGVCPSMYVLVRARELTYMCARRPILIDL